MIKSALINDWKASGIDEGDNVLIQSNVTRTLFQYLKKGYRISVKDVLESFLDAVGPKGTMIFPTFNFDFSNGLPFDIRNSPSRVGVLSEFARTYPGAVRTGHPVYSFAVIGAKADQFKGVNNFSGYGKDSPFGMLRAIGGKIAVLGLPDSEGITFYHHVEEMNEVSYRYYKKFTGPYTDWTGKNEMKTYSLFVRNIEQGVQTHVDPAGELLWNSGICKGFRPDEATGLRVVLAEKFYGFVTNIIESGRAEGLLYKIDKGVNRG